NMGNGTSELSGQPLDPQLFQGDILINQTFMYDVTIHHTTQKAFSKHRIIKFKQIDRQNEGLVKLKNRPNMQFCLEKHFQLSELLKNASIPARCRHPSILCIQRTISDSINNCLYFVTEPCLPLSVLIKFCSETDVLRGARSMLSALKFVHSSLNSSHNNLRLNSILVSPESEWKLSGFEYTLPFDQMNKHVIELLERLYEETDQPVTYTYSRTHPFCYDVYMFSRLFTQITKEYCSGIQTRSSWSVFTDVFSVFLARLDAIRRLLASFTQVMHAPATTSPATSGASFSPSVVPVGFVLTLFLLVPVLLTDLRHPLISSVEFFENYMTYSDTERTDFFRYVHDRFFLT
ncbi:uncharacterized protein DEA37_0003366, partial [Paragonimus westermani]